MQQNRTIITVITAWLLMLMPMMGRSQEARVQSPETGVRSLGYELRKENDSLYWLGVKGGRKADEWRLAHPVYQFQTGDVDGDGSEDAIVGVIKKTRYFPMGKRLFIFKQIEGHTQEGKQGRIRPPLTPPARPLVACYHRDARTQEGKQALEEPSSTRRLVRPMWLGSKLGGILEDFRFVAPADTTNTTHSAKGDKRGRIRALESTTDSLYVVSDYKWSGFGMKFDRHIIKGVDKETATKYLSQ